MSLTRSSLCTLLLRTPLFIPCRYGIGSLKESAERITATAAEAPEDHSIIFMGHNGPSGIAGLMVQCPSDGMKYFLSRHLENTASIVFMGHNGPSGMVGQGLMVQCRHSILECAMPSQCIRLDDGVVILSWSVQCRHSALGWMMVSSPYSGVPSPCLELSIPFSPGLGSKPHDMCGKDFPSKRQGIGGDFGDTGESAYGPSIFRIIHI